MPAGRQRRLGQARAPRHGSLPDQWRAKCPRFAAPTAARGALVYTAAIITRERRGVRLTTHLLIVTTGCALLAFALAMAVLLGLEHHAAMRQLEHIADTGARILRGQLMGLNEGVTLDARFPDWSALSVVTRSDGSCFKLEHPNGQPWRSDCRGGGADVGVPKWFAASYSVLFAPARRVTREIERGRETPCAPRPQRRR
jgi:hypothetical protein